MRETKTVKLYPSTTHDIELVFMINFIAFKVIPQLPLWGGARRCCDATGLGTGDWISRSMDTHPFAAREHHARHEA